MKEMKSSSQDTCTPMLTVTFFTVTQKQPTASCTVEKDGYMHTAHTGR